MDIRLIALDLDGTLLDTEKNLPPHFPEAVNRLRDHGVQVMIASGRQYYSILAQFGSYAEKLVYLAENGCLVFDRGKCLIEHSLPPEKWLPVYRASCAIPTATPLLLGVNSSYAPDRTEPAFTENWIRYCVKRTVCSDMETEPFASDRIVKIAIFDPISAEKNCLPSLSSQFQDEFNVALTEIQWVNIMPKGISKGSTLGDYAAKTGLRREECMAFGDYLNDAEMLDFCAYGYAMANSHPDLLKRAKFIAPANTENGVMKVLASHFPYLRDLVEG